MTQKPSTQDAISNWLSIQIVADIRKDDVSAKETAEFFRMILEVDYQISDITYELEHEQYIVSYMRNGKADAKSFPQEMAEIILHQVKTYPEQFKNYE